MNKLDKLLSEDYFNQMNSLKFSDKSKLYNLYEQPRHSKAFKKIFAANAIAVCLIFACGAIATKAADFSLRDVIKNSKFSTQINEEKIDEMESRLEDMGFDECSPQYDESDLLDINKNSDTIGNIFLGTDMMKIVLYDNGQSITGYCYTDDFSETNGFFSYNGSDYQGNFRSSSIRNWIYIYDKDGKTVIGKMIDNEFFTNEQLESSDFDHDIIDGDDIEEYEALCESRSQDMPTSSTESDTDLSTDNTANTDIPK